MAEKIHVPGKFKVKSYLKKQEKLQEPKAKEAKAINLVKKLINRIEVLTSTLSLPFTDKIQVNARINALRLRV